MTRLLYRPHQFGAVGSGIIAQANAIVEEYASQGFDLTLRQLYYQFVARGFLPNRDSEYKRLGSIVNDARMAGLIDWERIVDRTRHLRRISHWDEPVDIIQAAARSFRLDKWADQPEYLEVWIEKDALVGVIEGACQAADVPFFSCRGYTSQSEMWAASQRLLAKVQQGKRIRILHLGDHDPSGVDMSRDIEERLFYFLAADLIRLDVREANGDLATEIVDRLGERFVLDRLALNMDQVQQYNPPPNPAKITDSRSGAYIAEHGPESWELDALEPTVLAALIREAIDEHRDADLWRATVEEETKARRALERAAERWPAVDAFLASQNGGAR